LGTADLDQIQPETKSKNPHKEEGTNESRLKERVVGVGDPVGTKRKGGTPDYPDLEPRAKAKN